MESIGKNIVSDGTFIWKSGNMGWNVCVSPQDQTLVFCSRDAFDTNCTGDNINHIIPLDVKR